jgi:hypothetical protein
MAVQTWLQKRKTKKRKRKRKGKKEKEETRNKNLFLFNLVGKKIKIFLLFNKEVVHIIILYRRQGKNHEQQTGQERRQQ